MPLLCHVGLREPQCTKWDNMTLNRMIKDDPSPDQKFNFFRLWKETFLNFSKLIWQLLTLCRLCQTIMRIPFLWGPQSYQPLWGCGGPGKRSLGMLGLCSCKEVRVVGTCVRDKRSGLYVIKWCETKTAIPTSFFCCYSWEILWSFTLLNIVEVLTSFNFCFVCSS